MMKTNTYKLGHARGFTLIELLVVIAIIGILASVVLASLNTARDKGSNAAMKGALAQIRSQAELFYDVGRTYSGFCTNATTTPILANAQSNSASAAGVTITALASAGTATQVVCHDSATAYAVSGPLKAAEGANAYYCVDSTGKAAAHAAVLGASAVACP